MTLKELPIGHRAKITAVKGAGVLRDRLLDMGLTPHTEIVVRKVAPMGDPMEVMLQRIRTDLTAGGRRQH